MSQPVDISRCMGQAVPFGSEHTTECKSCTRSIQPPGVKFSWSNVMGPVLFSGKCFYKIETKNEIHHHTETA